MSEMALTGPRVEPLAGEPVKDLIIMLHGLGADGNDLIGLAPHFQHYLPNAALVSPDAHQPCDMAPFGRQWFSLQSREEEDILAGVEAAAPILNAFIDQEMDRYGLTPDRVMLFGFSQGSMMSLHIGPRRAEPLAGLMAFSGMLIAPQNLKEEIKSHPPALIIHGDKDDVVPVQALPAAVKALQENGVTVYQEIIGNLGHGIDQNGLEMALGFAMETLGYKKAPAAHQARQHDA